MAIFEGSDFILSTGRKVYANAGLLSISDDLSTISYGYDGIVYRVGEEGYDDDEKLTDEELKELADVMLDRWSRFKQSL